LEALLNRSWRVPFTSSLLVHEQECLRLLDQMRMAIPEEIRQAKRAMAERDRLVAQAQEESQRILAMAREQASLTVEDKEVIRAAERRAEAIVAQARKEAQEMETGAKEYAAQVLRDLADELARLQRQINNGLQRLAPSVPSSDSRGGLGDTSASSGTPEGTKGTQEKGTPSRV
jgi:cell division septum initiation protein DivIVA